MTPLQKSILNAVKRRPMTLRELQNNLQVDNSRLRTTVSAMVATGELSMRNGTYVPGFATYENAAAPNTIPCTLVKLAARFGFASRDDGEGDIFIPGRALHGAMPNDKINVKLFDHPRVEGSSEGEVVEVTVPNNRFAGTVCLSEDGRMAASPQEAFYAPKKSLPLRETEGMVCSEFVMCYPPGIPILAPGERITAEILDYIEYAKAKGCSMTGPEDPDILRLNVLA